MGGPFTKTIAASEACMFAPTTLPMARMPKLVGDDENRIREPRGAAGD
jgi:hypothetical protein